MILAMGTTRSDANIGAKAVVEKLAVAGSPADFGKRVSDDVEKWAKVIKFAGIKPD